MDRRFGVTMGLVVMAAVCVPATAARTDAVSGQDPKRDDRNTIVVAHRGASGSRPEHTLAAYRLAIEQ